MKIVLAKSTTGDHEFFVNPIVAKASIPLGILSLSSYLKENGFANEIIDLDYNERINPGEVNVVGFYSSMSSFPKVLKEVKEIKSENKDVITIAGGPQVEYLREDIFKFEGFDYAIYGEAELPLLEIIKSIKDKRKVRQSNGLITKNTENPKCAMFPDIDSLPMPDFEAFLKKDFNYIPVLPLETARGCTNHCPFCSIPNLFNGRRVKNINKVSLEIKKIKDLGINDVMITDPVIPGPWLGKISELLKEYEINSWGGYTRAGTVNKENLKKARIAGNAYFFWGGESGSPETLKHYNKASIEKQLRQEELNKEIGMKSCWSYIILNPGESRKEVYKTIDLVKKMKPAMTTLNPFTPAPYSDIELNNKEWGLVFSVDDWQLRTHEYYQGLASVMERSSRTPKIIKKLMKPFRKKVLKKVLEPFNYFNYSNGLDFTDTMYYLMLAQEEINKVGINTKCVHYTMIQGSSLGISENDLLNSNDPYQLIVNEFI